MKKNNGAFFYSHLESAVVQTVLGNEKQLRVCIIDITARKYAEEQSGQHQLALNEAANVSSVGGIASALAHEITQPLTAITNFVNGCVRRLKSDDYKSEELLDIMQKTVQQARRVGEVIHHIKDFARKGKPQYSISNLHNIIQAAVTSFYKEFSESTVKIELKLINAKLYFKADKIQVELALLNLLRNGIEAMKHIQRNGLISLIIQTQILRNDWVTVSVSDTGCGFIENDIEKLFESYFTTKPDGIGMGLWICRSVIEAHGGQLTARVVPTGGACFSFTLPLIEVVNHA